MGYHDARMGHADIAFRCGNPGQAVDSVHRHIAGIAQVWDKREMSIAGEDFVGYGPLLRMEPERFALLGVLILDDAAGLDVGERERGGTEFYAVLLFDLLVENFA